VTERRHLPQGLRVLVVEDEMVVAMLLEDMLTDLGCLIVGPASRVDEALQLAEREDVDAAILDVNVAGAEVYPVAAALAAKRIPFVFATGYGTGGLRDEYRGTPTVQKPFRQDDLARSIVEALAQRR
jgi:CheY-like chemotaxis protein